jgi:hypothetical protein
MSVRFIQPWNGYQPGQVASFSGEDGEPAEAALITAGLCRDAAENDNSGNTDLQAQITALSGALPTVAGDYANDTAAAAAGVALGKMYHTEGAAKLRVV